jgi:hypothetical protein
MYDIIGDVFGHYFELVSLLKKMGYINEKGKFYNPSGRKVIFTGNIIDKGFFIRETVNLVRDMVENESAYVVMGEHEYNAICFNTISDIHGGYLREHNLDNIYHHINTLEQYKFYRKDYLETIEWFKTLPLFLEFKDFRVVHAMWHQPHIDFLSNRLKNASVDNAFLQEAAIKGSDTFISVEETLRGKKIKQAEDITSAESVGEESSFVSIKWWKEPNHDNINSDFYSSSTFDQFYYYDVNQKTVIVGSYVMTGIPKMQAINIVCLNYNIHKGGALVAYRHDKKEKFLQVRNRLFD